MTTDRIFWNIINQTLENQNSPKYPPYNIVNCEDENRAYIEIAAAGFKESEISIVLNRGFLEVSGASTPPDESQYVYRGIAKRDFKRVFRISENTEVEDVYFEDGILTIKLLRIVPEKEQPKRIPINKRESISYGELNEKVN